MVTSKQSVVTPGAVFYWKTVRRLSGILHRVW